MQNLDLSHFPESIKKGFLDNDLEKGTYKNNAENRKLGRVGQPFGGSREKEFQVGEVYSWEGKVWDKDKKENVKVNKKVKITQIKPNGDILGKFEGESESYIIRNPEKYLTEEQKSSSKKEEKKQPNSQVTKLLEALKVSDNDYKDWNKITVESSPKGNWIVYYNGKNTGLIYQGKFLSENTVREFGLEHYD